MKKILISLTILSGIALSAAQLTARKSEPEVRKAIPVSKAEVARANEIENAILKLRNVKSLVSKVEEQSAKDKALLKAQAKQLAAMDKANKSKDKQIASKDKAIAGLKAALHTRAWKRVNWITISTVLIALFTVIGLVSGLLIGAFFRRTKIERILVHDDPPKAPAPIQPPPLPKEPQQPAAPETPAPAPESAPAPVAEPAVEPAVEPVAEPAVEPVKPTPAA